MATRFLSDQKNQILIGVGLILIVGFRMGLQFFLYRAGFLALTADEFGRMFLAERWANNHVIAWYGDWLPVYLVLFGSGLEVVRNMLWTPRFLVAGLGACAIVALYCLSLELFKSKTVALLSSLLLAVSPAAIWLSSTALTEMPYSLLIISFLTFFLAYWRSTRRGYLIVSALLLSLACGLRLEGWIITGLFCILLSGKIGLDLYQRKLRSLDLLWYGAAILIAVIFPVLWIVGNAVHFGDPLTFFNGIKQYKSLWYGQDRSYLNYLKTFFTLDPGVTLFAGFAFVFCLLRSPKSSSVRIYTALAFFPILIFVLLHGGQGEPAGNYIRYLAPFLFLLYPAFACFIYFAITGLVKNVLLARVVLGLGLAVIILTQIGTTFRFKNDPAGDGIAVGKTILKLRAGAPALTDRFVVIELSYWQYLAIHMGANDTTHILYDRELDLKDRNSLSLVATNWAAFDTCLAKYQVGFLVFKDPALRKIVEDQLKILPEKEVNGYAFYDLTRIQLPSIGQGPACPLLPGRGY